MSAMRAARCSATRWPTCSIFAGRGRRANITSTTPARRSTCSRARPILRYREALGEDIGPIPEGLYPGDYLKPVGEALAREFGARLRDTPAGRWLPVVRGARDRRDDGDDPRRSRGAQHRPRRVLLRARADRRRRRRRPRARGDRGCGRAASSTQGRLPPPKGAPAEDWEDREQTLFRSTEFGDDVDRPLIKSDGSYTYFAQRHRLSQDQDRSRLHRTLVDVWGADHGGYVKRMQAAVAALSDGRRKLDVRLCQLVRLMRAGEPVKMSKRSGDFVTLA